MHGLEAVQFVDNKTSNMRYACKSLSVFFFLLICHLIAKLVKCVTGTKTLQGSDDAVPIWYIMDEFGSRIQHSDTPSFRLVPFYYVPAQISFTIMWPMTTLEDGGSYQ